MARIRTIKPEFWTDDDLVTLPFEARLLFIGLWNFCDDHGYFWDEPLRIQLQILPADDIDCVALLNSLESSGALRKYRTDNENRYAWHIVNFKKHQRVSHARESEIAPLTRELANPPEPSGTLRPEWNGIEGNIDTSSTTTRTNTKKPTLDVVDLREHYLEQGHDPTAIDALLRSLHLRKAGYGTPVNDWDAYMHKALGAMSKAKATRNGEPARLEHDGEVFVHGENGWEREGA